MSRKEVYDVIDSERAYQQARPADHMVEKLSVGETLLAMEHLLKEARSMWYHSPGQDYGSVMHRVRKIAGLSVQLAEQEGMPRREGF